MMDVEILLPNLNDWFRETDGLCLRLQKMHMGQRISLDLHNIDFIKPSGAVMLILTCQKIHNKTGNIVTVTNIRPDVLTYLQRMKFFDYDFLKTDCALSRCRRNKNANRSDRVIEITMIHSPQDVVAFRNKAQAIIEHWFPSEGMKNDRSRFSTAIMELCNNSLEHSTGNDDLGMCFAALQGYSYQKSSPEISLSIGDLGIGIKSHLRRKYPQLTTTDVSFIEEAIGGLSGRLDNSGGLGLQTVRDTARDLMGRLVIRSGKGVVAVGSDIAKGEFENSFPGTQCQVILSKHR